MNETDYFEEYVKHSGFFEKRLSEMDKALGNNYDARMRLYELGKEHNESIINLLRECDLLYREKEALKNTLAEIKERLVALNERSAK